MTKTRSLDYFDSQETFTKTLLQQKQPNIKQGIRDLVLMKGKAVALITVLLITLLLIASFLSMKNVTEAPQLEWSKIFTRPPRTVYDSDENFTVNHHDFVSCFVQTSDGGYALATTLQDSYFPLHSGGVQNYTYQIIKMDSSGTIQWKKADPLFRDSQLINQTRDGGYIIATSISVLKTDNQGNIQWSKYFGMSVLRVFQAGDEGYVVAGTKSGYSVYETGRWIFKIDENGNMLWNKTLATYTPVGQSPPYGLLRYAITFDVAETSDGGYVAIGKWDTWSDYCNNLWLIRTDSNGELQMSRSYTLFNTPGSLSGPVILFDTKIYVTRDDSFILCGYCSREDYYSPFLAKISPIGTVEWSRAYADSRNNTGEFNLFMQTADGGFFAVGATGYWPNGDTALRRPLLVKTDRAGNVQWNVTGYYGLWDNGYASSGMVTNDGAYVVAGSVKEFVWLAKFAPEAPESQFSSYAVLIVAAIVIIAIGVAIILGVVFYRKRRKH